MEDNYVMARKPFNAKEFLGLPDDPEIKKAYVKNAGPYQYEKPEITVKKPIPVSGDIKPKAAPVMAPPAPEMLPEVPAPIEEPIVKVAQEAINPYQEEQEAPVERAPAAPESTNHGLSGPEWLAGLAPLAVDFLMGGNGGTDLAAQYFVDQGKPKKGNADNVKLAIEKLKLQREQAKTDRDVAKGQGIGGEIKNSTMDLFVNRESGGVEKLTNAQYLQNKHLYDPANEGQIRNYRGTLGADKAIDRTWKSGENVLDRDSRERLAFARIEEMKKKGAKARDIDAFKNFASKGSNFSAAQDKVYGAINAMQMLNDGGVIGENGLPTVIAKQIFGEVGNLSATDLQAANGDLSAIGLASKLYNRLMKGGKLEDSDRHDVETVIKAAHSHNAWKARQIAARTTKAYRSMGVNTEALEGFVDIPELPKLKNAIPATRQMGETVTVTRKSDKKTLRLSRADAATLDNSKYEIGE